MTKPEELNVDLVAELLTDLAVALPVDLAAAAMARRRPGSASGLLVSPVLHADVALLLTDVAVALLLTDLTVAAVATRTPGSASRLLVSTELLADLVVAPPKDLASEKKPLGKAGTSRDLVVALCMVVVAAVLAALEAAIFEDLASSTMATWP
ncbi:hypothetical protein PR003_g35087, partial [Phytophthora rubi]